MARIFRLSKTAIHLLLISLATALVLLSSCGGGGGGGLTPQPPGGGGPPLGGATGWTATVYDTLPPIGSANRAFQNAAQLAVAEQIFTLVNAERATAGVAPLANDVHLELVATAHAKDMATQDYFDHLNPWGMEPWDRLNAVSPAPNIGSGENIAVGQIDAADVMNSWMGSAGHRANILRAEFTHIGIGIYDDPTDLMRPQYVQMFAAFSGNPDAHDWHDPGEV